MNLLLDAQPFSKESTIPAEVPYADSRVEAGIFHSFYLGWASAISVGLNNGVLPSSHYSLCENHRDAPAPAFVELPDPAVPWADPGYRGKLRSSHDSPLRASFHDVCTHPEYAEKVLSIRRSDDHRVVGAIRRVAAETKRSRYRLDKFVAWVVEVLREGISVLIIDLFPPGKQDPQGIHKAIWDEFTDNDFVLPPDKPLTLASYLASPYPEAFIEPTAFRSSLKEMPIFLTADDYVPVPLEATYQSAFQGMPAYWRDVLDSP